MYSKRGNIQRVLFVFELSCIRALNANCSHFIMSPMPNIWYKLSVTRLYIYICYIV